MTMGYPMQPVHGGVSRRSSRILYRRDSHDPQQRHPPFFYREFFTEGSYSRSVGRSHEGLYGLYPLKKKLLFHKLHREAVIW
jgi:hypothetical protein